MTSFINPKSYSHFLFGTEGEFSASPNELWDLKRQNNNYDLDNAFDQLDRTNELEAALAQGTRVVWCLAEPKHTKFFGGRQAHVAYLEPDISTLINRAGLMIKKGRRIGSIDPESPFAAYFGILGQTQWAACLSRPVEGYTSIASTPEGYSLGRQVSVGATVGWIVTPPTSPEAENQLILDCLRIGDAPKQRHAYHDVFMSHTGDDKPFVRRLRADLVERGVPKVWVDEGEIQIGDSLLAKIDQGIKETRFVAVVLSEKSVGAKWLQKELEIAMAREMAGGEVVVLPLLYEKCDLPGYLQGKLYADFTTAEEYETSLAKLLRRLRVT